MNDLNINKLLIKAVGFGYRNTVSKPTLVSIQDWIINEYKIVPYIQWCYDKKKWKSFVYDYDFDPLVLIKTIIEKNKIDNNRATNIANEYINKKYLVINKENNSNYFDSAQEALYYAIEKSYKIIKEIIENKYFKDSYE